MSKKEKSKPSKVEELKAGDEIGVEIDGKEQAITLDAEQAKALNEQLKEGAEESKEESAAPKEKVLNGTPRFNKFNK